MKRKTLIVITDFYPSGGATEKAFITPGLPALRREFGSVIFCPLHRPADVSDILPQGCEVDTALADAMERHILRRHAASVFTGDFLKGMGRIMADGGPWQWMREGAVWSNALTIADALGRMSRCRGLNAENAVALSFWAHHAATGLAIFSRRTHIPAYSRAHNYDLFHSRTPGLDGFPRRFTLGNLRGVHTVSGYGREYLAGRFPGQADKVFCTHLGSLKLAQEDFVTPPSPAGELTFLSCARLVPLKRVRENFRLVASIARRRPADSVRWIHCGDGEQARALEADIENLSPANLLVKLMGNVPNGTIHQIYAKEHIDWTILLSEIEGLPVTLMESMSYGVPAIVSDVPGNNEIVTPDRGILLPLDFDEGKAAEKILSVTDDTKRYKALKDNALDVWRKEYSAERLRQEFASLLSHS